MKPPSSPDLFNPLNILQRRNLNVVNLTRGCRVPLWLNGVPRRDSLTQLNFYSVAFYEKCQTLGKMAGTEAIWRRFKG